MYLPQIKVAGEQLVGANREKQLSFFSTVDDVLASNDLATTILSAILSDCEKTVDAINLAVRWRDPVIIRTQLDESQDVDPRGISKALLNALLASECKLAHFKSDVTQQLLVLPKVVHQLHWFGRAANIPEGHLPSGTQPLDLLCLPCVYGGSMLSSMQS